MLRKITGADIIEEARRWIGTPWRHQAYLRGVGCDCIGLIGGVAAEVGLNRVWLSPETARFKSYGRHPNPDMLLEACDNFLDPIRRPEALGDILVFSFVDRSPQHFGLLSRLDPHYIIHAHISAGRVVENRLDDKWLRRLMRTYRFREIG